MFLATVRVKWGLMWRPTLSHGFLRTRGLSVYHIIFIRNPILIKLGLTVAYKHTRVGWGEFKLRNKHSLLISNKCLTVIEKTTFVDVYKTKILLVILYILSWEYTDIFRNYDEWRVVLISPHPTLVCLTTTVKPSFIRIGFLIKMMW